MVVIRLEKRTNLNYLSTTCGKENNEHECQELKCCFGNFPNIDLFNEHVLKVHENDLINDDEQFIGKNFQISDVKFSFRCRSTEKKE